MSQQQIQSPAWQSYVDLDTAKKYLQFPADRTDSDEQLQLFVDGACWWVQDYLGRPVAPTQFMRRFDGWSGWQGSNIMLPYSPVIEVVSVIEYRGSSSNAELVEQTPSAQALGSESYQIDPLTGRLMRTFPGLVQKPWFPGTRNIEVTWIAGYNPIPPTIRMATFELFAHWYRNTQESPKTFRGSLGEYDAPDSKMWAAVPHRVMTLLQTYEQVGIG